MEMKFLKQFWKTLKGFIPESVGSHPLSKTDILGRFLTSSSHFSKGTNRVKHNALMPYANKKSNQLETSIFNIEGLSEKEIKDIASKSVLINLKKGRSVYGTGNIKTKDVNTAGLKAEISEPPIRHLNIIGWPEEKSKQKQIAMELSSKAVLSLFDNKVVA